jgi:uncharacterized glyoxalase superfamily protein PhnB
MADEYPGVIPLLSYENCVAALEWLARTFGFRERTRIPELVALDPGTVFLRTKTIISSRWRH